MKGRITITRNSKDVIRIAFRDDASRIEFAVAEMTPEAFGFAITGLSEQEVDLKVGFLDRVGKLRIIEARSIDCPLQRLEKEEMRAWLRANAQEDGWILDDYLGSQSSVSPLKDGKGYSLNYRVVKYVDPPISEPDSMQKESAQ